MLPLWSENHTETDSQVRSAKGLEQWSWWAYRWCSQRVHCSPRERLRESPEDHEIVLATASESRLYRHNSMERIARLDPQSASPSVRVDSPISWHGRSFNDGSPLSAKLWRNDNYHFVF